MSKDDLVNNFLRLAPPLIAEVYPDTRVCVFAARVTVETLSYFGIPAKPWPCRLVAMNSIAAEAYVDGRAMQETWAAGGYALGQHGTGELLDGEGFRWDGHVAVVVEHYSVEGGEAALLLDPSFGDLDKPDKGVHTSPLRADVPQRMIDTKARIHLPLANDGLAFYHPLDSSVWKNAPDWRIQSRWRPVVSQLVRALRVAGEGFEPSASGL